ncbi:hypothetical protein [Aerococcus viridans]|nr:hypothetical protein [Aerococcus viridans]
MAEIEALHMVASALFDYYAPETVNWFNRPSLIFGVNHRQFH